jgi:hypothetical protein
MKKAGLIIIALLVMTAGFSQKPVNWNYSVKKISKKVYEVHLKATIEDGWHLYAQQQPDNFIGTKTTIKFNQHPLLFFNGAVKEVGSLQRSKEPVLETESWQYKNEVDFVQKITLKSNGKTNVTGSIEFQVCTDDKCLPPDTVQFNVLVE